MRTLRLLLPFVLVIGGAIAPLRSQVREIRDVTYARVGAITLELDLYLPENATAPVPCVVWMHWGGWRSGIKNVAKDDAHDLVAAGLAVAAVEYRLSGLAKWPAQIHDCKGAVRWLRANAATYNLDPDRFAAFGSSSGGHLAAMLATSGGVHALEGDVGGNLEQSSRVQAAADFLGPTDLFVPPQYEPADSFASELVGKAIGEIKQHRTEPAYAEWVALVESVDPARYASRDDPPVFIGASTDDETVPFSQSQWLYDELRKAGVESVLGSATKGHSLPQYMWNWRRDWLVAHLLRDVPFRSYGRGCAAAQHDEPAIGATPAPKRNAPFDVTLTSAPRVAPAIAFFGGGSGHVPLDVFGATGCVALLDTALLVLPAVTGPQGDARAPLFGAPTLPPKTTVTAQWAILDLTANALGFVFSNGGRIWIE